MAEPRGEFAGVLRELRTRARLTQEGLAAAAGLSHRTVSDLERGLATTPQQETTRLLADALGLVGTERERFETTARGHPLPSAPASALRSLPRDVASFTGRTRELEQLARSAATAGGVVSIHAIGGMAGVGKTAFAVHAAHQVADRFPGGQLFVLLHGHTPGRAPADPADALASLLLATGVPASQVPPDQAARAALWRDRAAARPLLLVLDDAADSEQVRPLLPGSGGSLVLVTSRRHLSALDDATVISLDTLRPDDAAALLVRLAGRAGLGAGDPGVRDIIRLCGFLPLAIGLVARQLRYHPAWTAAGRAAELATARDRLALLETENLSVTAAFDLSYATLTADQQRLFRRLGLHPGTDIDGYAAAALDGISLSAARRGLEALYDQYLLAEPARGRYQPHDLIREHARALAARLDPDQDRDAATTRLLDYYQQTAAVANARISSRTGPGPAAGGPGAAAVPVLADQEQSLAWVRAERASLLACLDHAVAAGQHARVIALTAGLSGLWQHDGPWADAIARHRAAAAAARRLGDRPGQADALCDLGSAQQRTGDYPAAVRGLEEALGLYRDLADRGGQANALTCLGTVKELSGVQRAMEEVLSICRDLGNRLGQASALSRLGVVRQLTGQYAAARQAQEQALGLYRDLGNQHGQANALNYLGTTLRLTGDYPAAARALDQALGLYRGIGDRGGEAEALNARGTLHLVSGEVPLAQECHRRSLDLSRELGSAMDEAHALAGLGRCALACGDAAGAESLLRQALGIFQRIGAAESADLLAEMEGFR
jgi:tetratricopeptide (TPR) repeat protein/transcriptional regulator with XRE-family HTH domain